MTTYLTPMRGNLSRDLDSISRSMRGILNEDQSRWRGPEFLGFPAVNVSLTEEQISVWMFAPGLDKDSLDISIVHNHLTISGERQTDSPEEARVQREERFHGKFRRLVTLPKDVEASQVEASYRDGVVRIQLGRKFPRKTRIEIE